MEKIVYYMFFFHEDSYVSIHVDDRIHSNTVYQVNLFHNRAAPSFNGHKCICIYNIIAFYLNSAILRALQRRCLYKHWHWRISCRFHVSVEHRGLFNSPRRKLLLQHIQISYRAECNFIVCFLHQKHVLPDSRSSVPLHLYKPIWQWSHEFYLQATVNSNAANCSLKYTGIKNEGQEHVQTCSGNVGVYHEDRLRERPKWAGILIDCKGRYSDNGTWHMYIDALSPSVNGEPIRMRYICGSTVCFGVYEPIIWRHCRAGSGPTIWLPIVPRQPLRWWYLNKVVEATWVLQFRIAMENTAHMFECCS